MGTGALEVPVYVARRIVIGKELIRRAESAVLFILATLGPGQRDCARTDGFGTFSISPPALRLLPFMIHLVTWIYSNLDWSSWPKLHGGTTYLYNSLIYTVTCGWLHITTSPLTVT